LSTKLGIVSAVKHRGRAPTILLVLGLLLGLGLSALALRSTTKSVALRRGSPANITSQLVPQAPADCGGTQVTPQTAQNKVAFRILMPNHRLANSNTLTKLLLCPSGTLWLTFSSRLEILLERNSIPDPAAVWASWASESPTYRRVGTLKGQPAILDDPTKQGNPAALTAAEFVFGGRLVIIRGPSSISLQDVTEVGESLYEY
jgi:hypothetical protein